MRALVGTELLKLRTTRAWIGVVAGLVLLTGIGAASAVGGTPDGELGSTDLSRSVISASLFAGFLAFLLGITLVTSEWRHGTIARTFLAVPRRARVVLGKVLTGVAVGLAFGVLGLLIVLSVAVVWLAVEGSSFTVDSDVAGLVVRVLLAAALWGALGVGVGATVQSQTPALVGALVWMLVAENLIGAALGLVDLDGVADLFPGHSLAALEGEHDQGLDPSVGGIVGLGWVVALGALGVVRMERRDVT